MIHRLKTLTQYYQPIIEKRKPFEIRNNDRNFQTGDSVILNEWDALDILIVDLRRINKKTRRFFLRVFRRVLTFGKGFGIICNVSNAKYFEGSLVSILEGRCLFFIS